MGISLLSFNQAKETMNTNLIKTLQNVIWNSTFLAFFDGYVQRQSSKMTFTCQSKTHALPKVHSLQCISTSFLPPSGLSPSMFLFSQVERTHPPTHVGSSASNTRKLIRSYLVGTTTIHAFYHHQIFFHALFEMNMKENQWIILIIID